MRQIKHTATHAAVIETVTEDLERYALPGRDSDALASYIYTLWANLNARHRGYVGDYFVIPGSRTIYPSEAIDMGYKVAADHGFNLVELMAQPESNDDMDFDAWVASIMAI